jgi:hypothetical protein
MKMFNDLLAGQKLNSLRTLAYSVCLDDALDDVRLDDALRAAPTLRFTRRRRSIGYDNVM